MTRQGSLTSKQRTANIRSANCTPPPSSWSRLKKKERVHSALSLSLSVGGKSGPVAAVDGQDDRGTDEVGDGQLVLLAGGVDEPVDQRVVDERFQQRQQRLAPTPKHRQHLLARQTKVPLEPRLNSLLHSTIIEEITQEEKGSVQHRCRRRRQPTEYWESS